MVFCNTERGSLKKKGRVMWVKSLPNDSFRMDHMMDQMLLLSSFCLGVGRASLLVWGKVHLPAKGSFALKCAYS